MFGIIYILGRFICFCVSGTKMAIEDYILKQDAINKRNNNQNRSNTYTDHYGVTRDIDTNAIRYIYPDKKGDVWVEDIKGNRLRNLSQERRNDEFETRKQNNDGHRAIKYDNWTRKNSLVSWGDYSSDRITGNIYKDVNNGKLYVERKYIEWNQKTKYAYNSVTKYCLEKYFSGHFYMDISNGMLVGLSDSEQPETCTAINRYKPNKKDIEEFIQFFNQKQKEGGWYDAYGRDHGWESCKKYNGKHYYLAIK